MNLPVMFALLDLLFEGLAVFFEGALELAGDLVLEFIFRSLGQTFTPSEKRNSILAGFGYALLGLIAGGLSLLIFPQSFARSEEFHGISLLVSTVLAGLGMAGLGWLLKRSGKRVLRLDSFVYGFIFAAPMAIVRYLYTS
jgi:hypothetical protein